MSHGGKGDKPRPFVVSKEEFAESHNRIFGTEAEQRKLQKQKENEEFFAKLKAETEARINGTATNQVS